MKKISYSIIILVIFSILYLAIYHYEIIQIFLFNILNYLMEIHYQNFLLFIILLFICNFILFLTPIPTFPIIIFNGFLLKDLGFLFTYFIVILCSMILFNCSRYIKIFQKIKYFKKLIIKINDNVNADLNFFVIASSRYVLPYFVHNVFFGSILKNAKTFLIAIIISEIPVIFALNKFGKYINDFNNIKNFTIENVLKTEYILFFALFLCIFVVINRFSLYLKSKIK